MLHHCFTQPTKWTEKINGLADMWLSRSKPKQGVGFTSNGRHSSSISRLLPPTPCLGFDLLAHMLASPFGGLGETMM